MLKALRHAPVLQVAILFSMSIRGSEHRRRTPAGAVRESGGASASLRAAESRQERASHHTLRRRDVIEQLERKFALIYQHPRAIRIRSSERDRLTQKWCRFGAIDEVIEKAFG